MVVTGVGMATALGDAEETFQGLLDGRSGVQRVEVDGVGEILAAPAAWFDPDARFERRNARRMDRASQLVAAAALDALAAAGELGLPATRIGTAAGSAHGGPGTIAAGHETLLHRGPNRVSPFTIPLGLGSAPAAAAARAAGLRGPSLAPATACAAGADAVGQAALYVRQGLADVMVAGGGDAPIVAPIVAGYRNAGALASPRADRLDAEVSRPFDRDRSGFVIAEGAAMLVLEEREHALARGAAVLAEVSGYGASCDAGHLTDPEPDGGGPATAVAAALADAGADAADVEMVSAHATSTPAGDRAEARALTRAGVSGAAVFAAKGALGHALGGAGAIEAALCVLAIARGVIPPTLNLTTTDEDDPLSDHVREPRPGSYRLAVSTSFGFGGHNGCLVVAAP